MLQVRNGFSEKVRESEMRTRGILQRGGGVYLPRVEGRINKKSKLPNLDGKQYAKNGSEALTDTAECLLII